MKKRVVCLLLGIVVLSFLTIKPSTAWRSRGVRGEPFTTTDGFFGIEFNHDAPQLDLYFKTIYTSSLKLKDWKITDNKNLMMDLQVRSKPNNTLVWIEHMHVDCFLESTRSEWDGVKVDYMDDRFHGTGSPGFYVDVQNDYSETFSVEGFSDFVIDYYTFYVNNIAVSDADKERLTETYLVNRSKVYGISFFIVYDIIYRDINEPEDRIKKFMLEDNIIIDLIEGAVDNRGDKADKPSQEVFGFGIVAVVVGIVTLIAIKKKKRRK